MRRFRTINQLSESEFLEIEEQNELIRLLNDESYQENRSLVKLFVTIFMGISPIYIAIPFFRRQHPITGFVCVTSICVSCFCMYWLNPFATRHRWYVQKEFGELNSFAVKASGNKAVLGLMYCSHLALGLGVVQWYLNSGQWDMNAPFLVIPVISSVTCLVLYYWAYTLLQRIDGLAGARYDKKNI